MIGLQCVHSAPSTALSRDLALSETVCRVSASVAERWPENAANAVCSLKAHGERSRILNPKIKTKQNKTV